MERITMIDAIKEACGVDFNEINTDEEAVALAKERKIEIPVGKEKEETLSVYSLMNMLKNYCTTNICI